MTTTYREFLESKTLVVPQVGIDVNDSDINQKLYPFQRQLVVWALRKGRCALFADTGLGKTWMQLEWARILGAETLIVAPLAVAQQTVEEAKKLSIVVRYARRQSDVSSSITITNYEMIRAFDFKRFGAVVLDESSILKSVDGKTRSLLIEMCRATPYRLCCTATPAPNDIAEFANHSEFLGVASRQEMLSMFFVHDDKGWRLKGYAQDAFYKWMASWAMMVKLPSDIGFQDDGYLLPELRVIPEFINADADRVAQASGQLFFVKLKGIESRAQVRRATVVPKVQRAASIINSTSDQWVVWCGLNDEGTKLHAKVPSSVLVEGRDSLESKLSKLVAFLEDRPDARVLITKQSIAGFGLNLQHCHNMMFIGMNDSYEQWYQAIRRCYRFGQAHPVNVYVMLSDMEREILDNVRRKERQAQEVSRYMIENVSEYQKEQLGILEARRDGYRTGDYLGEDYRLMLGDCVERMTELDDESVDFSVFSPPFLSLYVYSDSERDMGNSKTPDEFFTQFGFFLDELHRVMKPGRNVACHVAQVPASLTHDGYIGLKDFRGRVIDRFIRHAFIYHGEIVVDKDPQAQAIRTKSKALLFVQLKKDASWLRPGLADYVLVFRKPGDNAVPIHPDISNEEWIEWARPIWYNIRESDTLHVAEARSSKDERHIAPLQLGTIERCIRLWSNQGETVLSPFAGIGSELYQALILDRRAIGIELKLEYWEIAKRNIRRALERRAQGRLF